jgi:hypothetical protein
MITFLILVAMGLMCWGLYNTILAEVDIRIAKSDESLRKTIADIIVSISNLSSMISEKEFKKNPTASQKKIKKSLK